MGTSWKERLSAARDSASSVRMADSDFLARKMLGGLGWTEKGLYKLCTLVGVEPEDGEQRMTTVRRILDFVSGGQFSQTSPSRRFSLDVRECHSRMNCWKDGDDLRSLCAVASTMKPTLIAVVRAKSADGHDTGVAHVFLKRSGDVPEWLLRPVSSLVADVDGVKVWRRDVRQLVHDMAECLGWSVPSSSDK